MNRIAMRTLTALPLLLGLVLPTGEAIGQQAGPTFHRYLVRAVLTAEGLKNLQKQPPTALKAGVAKFVESVGGKLEFWYFDYGAATAYSVIDYPNEVAAATAQLSTNAAGFARVTIRPLLTAEEMDQAVAKWPPSAFRNNNKFAAGHRRVLATRKLRRSSAAVATSREGHRSPRAGREVRHRRWERERSRRCR